MSWLSKNVGSLGNLASRIAAEANGDHQETQEALQQLNQQLQDAKDELFVRQREWEAAKTNYEARLKTLTDGDATAQKVEQLENKLNRAVELLKTVNKDKQNLGAKVATLEETLKETEARAVAAEEIVNSQKQEIAEFLASASSSKVDHARLQKLEEQLKKEQEQHVLLVESLQKQLAESAEANKTLKATLEEQANRQNEESNSQVDLAIQLEIAKDGLEQANQEISSLKEANAKLAAKANAGPNAAQVATQASAVHAKELAEAKATIADLEQRLLANEQNGEALDALKSSQKDHEATLKSIQAELTEAKTSYSKSQAELAHATEAHVALEAKAKADQVLDREANTLDALVCLESLSKLMAELAFEKAKTQAAVSTANGGQEESEELASRIQKLEQELEVSKEVFSEKQIDAVALAIKSLLDASRTDVLPKSLTHDKILATWNRVKDEVDSYKDGNRALEENLSRLRRENLEAQSQHKANLERLEATRIKENEQLKNQYTEMIQKVEEKFKKESLDQDQLNTQIAALKAAESEAQKAIKEKFDAEKRELLEANELLKQQLEGLNARLNMERQEAEKARLEREAVIRDLEKSVSTGEQIIKSIKEDLQRTTEDRNKFQAQHKVLLERVSNMKSTLGTRLQSDMENINTLKQQIEELTKQNNDYLLTIKQLEEELMASHEHYEKTSRELEHLRRRLVDIQEENSAEIVEKENYIHELQSRLQREEREREDWETMASEQRASKDQAIANMRAMERERDAAKSEKEVLRHELDREIESLNNLQAVLEEFQSAKESEIQFALEGLHRQLNTTQASLEEYQSRATSAEEQLRQMSHDVERAHQLEREIKEKSATIGKLRHDAVIQQGHLTEAMRRLKEENNQNTVDIPLISNLFISFLNIPRGDQKRFEILQLISGVLKFTDEQKAEAGLIRKAGPGLGAMTPSGSGSRSPSMEQMRQPEPKEDLFMCESYFDEYTTTGGSTVDQSQQGLPLGASALSQQLQQQQQQFLQQFTLQQQQQLLQQQQQQLLQQQQPQLSALELQFQTFLASNAAQQQQFQQQQQQQQQLQQQQQQQHEQQQLFLNSQTQLAAFRWALANASNLNSLPTAGLNVLAMNNNSTNTQGISNTNTNSNSNINSASAMVTSPSDSGAFFSSPDMTSSSSLSPEMDTLMLPNSPGPFSSGDDGAMLSPLLQSSQSTSVSQDQALSDSVKVKTEKTSSKSAKRQSMDDGTDNEIKPSSSPSGAPKRSKKTSTKTATKTAESTGEAVPSAPKKPRAKKTSKNNSDQSDMEMSSRSAASPRNPTLSPPLSIAGTVPTTDSTSSSSAAGIFQTLPLLPITPPAQAFGQPHWKITPGIVLPPAMPGLTQPGFDPAAFAPGSGNLDATVNAPQTGPSSGVVQHPSQQPQPHMATQTVQQKIPITRLKPPQALVTPPPAPPSNQGPQPTKQQKKVAHNAIERRYRNNINDRINDLKNVVPALCNIKTKDEKDDDDEDDGPVEADGVTKATKLNKATILRKATEYIIVLQKREAATKVENAALRQLLTSLPGGVDLLEQHQTEMANMRDNNSPGPESSSEESNGEPSTPPPSSSSSSGGPSRVLMAVFMCATFFSSPEGSSRLNKAIMDDGQGAGRAMSASHTPSRAFGQATGADSSIGGSFLYPLGHLALDAWAAVRTLVFMACLVALVWRTYSPRGPFAQSRFPAMPKSSSPVQVYTTLSGLLPKIIPSSYFRLFIALSLELWRCLWIRLGIYPDLTDMVRPDIWARVVEAQMSGGAGASGSRFMLLYTIVRTLDEYTNARRQPPARVSATAALAFYISIRRGAQPLATLVAQQFMESARYTARIFGTGQDRWLESMLQVEVGSAAWNQSVLEIESCMYGRGEHPQTDDVLYQTMAPTLVVAQTYSVSLLQDAYVNCMSRLNESSIQGRGTSSLDKQQQQQHLPQQELNRTVRFDDVVRATQPGTRQHWYALVGKISELWLSKDENSAMLGDRLMGEVMKMHPQHHLTSTHSSSSNKQRGQDQEQEIESQFQYYDQVIVYSLLEYAYLRRGLAGPSVRCGEKAWALLNERRRAMGAKIPTAHAPSTTLASPMTDGSDNEKALLSVACFAMNLTGFVEIKARIGLWRGVEVMSSLVKKSRGQTEGSDVDDNADVSQAEILDHIRTTLLPLTVHLRRQLDDESATMLVFMQMASATDRNKDRRVLTIDFDPALRFLIDIGRVAYGAWEDVSEGSDSGCSSGGEDEGRCLNGDSIEHSSKGLVTKKTDAEKAWDLCQYL
ncbi:hypothetical protein BGZ94_008255 [Podila epigama]|nr:hypothetical protein BGZ94_008255 [Podila epigama]